MYREAQGFNNGGVVDKEESEDSQADEEKDKATLSKRELLDMLVEKQALQNLIDEMPSVRLSPSVFSSIFKNQNAKGRFYDVGADLDIGDKYSIGTSGQGTSVKFDGGKFKEKVLNQLRGSYTTDDGIRYSAEYSPMGNRMQVDPSQKAYRLSRRNLKDQSEISLSREPGRMGFDMPGQLPDPGSSDTTFLRYTKEFNKGGVVDKGEEADLPDMLTKEGKFKPFEPAEKKPLGKKSGKPITDQGPSAMDVASFINSFLPVTGDIQSAAEGYQAFKDKDYVGASLGALGALPFVPNMTKIVKQANIKELAKTGKIQQAKSTQQELNDLISGKTNFAEVRLNWDDPKTYDLADKLKKQGFDSTVMEQGQDMITLFHKPKADLTPILNAKNPYDFGKAYGYTDNDIAAFYTTKYGKDAEKYLKQDSKAKRSGSEVSKFIKSKK